MQAYYDNQFLFPMQEHITWRTLNKLSCARGSVFFMTADEARDCNGEPIELSDLGGCFDLARLNKAMNAIGITNPLYLSEWSTQELPYRTYGKLRATGADFVLEYAPVHWFSLGAAFTLMHVSGRIDYCVTTKAQQNLSIIQGNQVFPGRESELERARLNANTLLGINPGQWAQTGLGDIELFTRWGTIKEYWWKFKQVDLNLLLDLILPTGTPRAIGAPASVAFGWNGHTGVSARLEGVAEVTDDCFLGLWVLACKRLSKTQCARMPMGDEPLNYGVLVDRATVNPGATVGFSLYLLADDIQDGFGAYGAYTLFYHCKDCWRYCGSYTPRLDRLSLESEWINEFFTLGLDYDFTKTPTIREYAPRVFFDWTLPTNIFAARRIPKNHRISLGIEFHF
jgi:hypothetical protein